MSLNFKIVKRIIPLVCALLFFSCSSQRAPPIDPPFLALEKAREDASQNPLFVSTDWVPSKWWELFYDEQLTGFILKTFERNPTLHSAKANILLAAAAADSVRARLFPYTWWGGDVSRQKLSTTGVFPFGNISVPITTTLIPEYFTLSETQANLTYEFDIWGKNRNSLSAAVDQLTAQVADLAFSRLQLSIAVAAVYFQLQIEYKRREIGRALVNNRIRFLELIEERVQNSLENALTLHNAENNLSIERERLIEIEGAIAVHEYQLKAYLADDFEEEISNIQITEKALIEVPLPKELPLHLLAHRPDIIAQLWLIESAGRQIEVAKAGFYPDFNISALFGFQTIHFRELFKWPSSYFNIDPAFTLPLFDGGRLLANLHWSEVNYDQAIFEYNELVIQAAKEVLDGLAVLLNTKSQLDEYKKMLEFQTENFQLTSARVEYNLDSLLSYLDSESNMLHARQSETIALGNTMQAILALIKALGGGFDPCQVEI